ncbi:MAG: YicC family protein [Gammaproteobacteria bacterium]|nr:YicC family protein [Gammaproteobacteria bacterium]
MIQSMTAFARTQEQGEWGNIVCELRSINHRYLELNVRLPDALQKCEAIVREKARDKIKRGKVECLLRFHPNEIVNNEISVNSVLVKQLCDINEVVAQHLKNPAQINPIDILKWPGVLQVSEIDIEQIQKQVIIAFEKTLQDLIIARQREGEQLQHFLNQRLDTMIAELKKVKLRIPAILIAQREKLQARFLDAKLQCDPTRLEQELVIAAQKIDVTEELDRLDTHILEVRRCLNQDEAVGRRLDFLMQELNREANTLGSKSVDTETTHVSVELKVLIEQMREQVQNIE